MSSFYTDASLVMIPSGYKDQKVYCAKPVDGSADLTFSRGSDIEATRVAANGYIEKAKVNLLLQSNSFSTTWITVNSTLTSGQSGYDGSTDAWKLESTLAGVSASVRQTVSVNSVSTFSAYAKVGNVNFITLYCASSGTPFYAWFNLSSGTIATTSSDIDTSITSIGGGWYRVSITGLNPNQRVDIYPANADGSYITAVGEYIYIQDAQLNYGLVAQEYQETTTTSVVSGITNDLPRLDYSGGATCPSLLLEPSRTNLINQSEWFGGHTLFASNADTNSITSPEGVLNGSEVRPNSGININISTANGYTAGASAYVAKSVGTLTASTYTFSAFVKKTDLNLIQFRAADDSDLSSANGVGAVIDLDTYTLVSETLCTTTIEPYALGWYRISITFTATAATWYAGFWYWNKTSITVDGTQGYGVYGSQFESGSYMTSLIPTYGTSATRTSDSAYRTGISSLIGQTEGTLYLEFSTQPEGASDSRISISGGSNNNWIFLSKDGPEYRAYVRASNSVAYSNTSEDILDSSVVKMAIAYKSGEIAYYFNGTLRSSSSSFSFDATLDRLIIGNTNTVSDVQEAIKINQLLLFPTRLSNADLATLTTL